MTIAQSLIAYFISPMLGLLILIILFQVILSWLIQFKVVNISNSFVATVYDLTSRIVHPILSPLQKQIPTIGNIDVSPIVAILALQWFQGFILPKIYNFLG